MKIQILVDNPDSWMNPYARKFAEDIDASFIQSHEQIERGDILLLLSCEQKLVKRDLNKYNLVVHESDLPKGKGWSPLTWQVLEGKKEITVSLIEAEDQIDSGVIYDQVQFQLEGHELIDELREMQASATLTLIRKFLGDFPSNHGTPQVGEESFYKKRKPEDSQLDINRSLVDQFNLLRVCDNDRYPAFFFKDGIKYILRIEKDERY